MSEGLGSRLTRLRSARTLSARDTATLAGIAYGDLLRLENGSKRFPGADAVRRLAEIFFTSERYLLEGADPTTAELRSGFFRFFEAAGAQERQRLKYAPIQDRVDTVLLFLEQAYPTLLSRGQVAARIGLTPEALADVLQDRAPLQSYSLKLLAQMAGISLDFLVRGDFFGGAVPLGEDPDPARLSQYYEVVREAMSAGIGPAALRKAVQILALRDRGE